MSGDWSPPNAGYQPPSPHVPPPAPPQPGPPAAPSGNGLRAQVRRRPATAFWGALVAGLVLGSAFVAGDTTEIDAANADKEQAESRLDDAEDRIDVLEDDLKRSRARRVRVEAALEQLTGQAVAAEEAAEDAGVELDIDVKKAKSTKKKRSPQAKKPASSSAKKPASSTATKPKSSSSTPKSATPSTKSSTKSSSSGSSSSSSSTRRK